MQNMGIMDLENNSEIRAAYDYFEIVCGDEGNMASNSEPKFSGYNEFGMVDFYGVKDYKQDSSSNDMDLNSVIESLSNILIAAVLKHAGTSSEEQVSPSNWKRGFNEMCRLFFSDYTSEELNYSESKVGKEIVETMIKICFDLNGEPEGNLKEAMRKYLEKQGGLMDNAGYGSKNSIPYSMLGFTNYKKDGSTPRICSLRAYFTKFNSETIKISHSCSKDEKKFDFDFHVEHYNADFMINNWENNPDFRKRVIDFINNHQPDSPYFDIMDTAYIFRV